MLLIFPETIDQHSTGQRNDSSVWLDRGRGRNEDGGIRIFAMARTWYR